MKKSTIIYTFLILQVLPVVVYAQNGDWFYTLAGQLLSLLPLFITTLSGVAVLLFLWGLARFILNSGDEKVVAEGKKMMVWGVVALFVLLAVWGLVALLQSIIGTPDATHEVPQVINIY